MTLPLGNSPWLLSPDDVLGYRLANARGTRLADTRECLDVEHTAGETGAGEHNTTQIARAVFVFRMPKFDPTSDLFGVTAGQWGYGADIPLVAYGPSAGWVLPPVLRHNRHSEGGTPEEFYFIDCVPNGDLLGLTFTPVFDSELPTWSYAEMHALIPRRSFVSSAVAPRSRTGAVGKAGRIFLGYWDSIKDLKGGTIVAHTAVEKEE